VSTQSRPAPLTRRKRRPRQRLGYQPALDGIRAVAVVAVVLFHAGVTWLPGGFLGVDLFFVLSGFLITTLLLEEWGVHGSIGLGPFWGRRARRLFPALALVLAAVAVYGATAAPPATRSGLRWDGVASLLYVANWRFVFGHQSYFASFAVPSPLRHLWSLAVEEQWYVVWPPVLIGLLRLQGQRRTASRRLETVLGVLAVLTLASFAQMLRLDLITHGAADAGRSYYGTDTHIQVLLIGAMLAVARLRWPPDPSGRTSWASLAGLGGAAVCVLMFVEVAGSDRWLYRGGFAVFAIAAAAVVSAAVSPRGTPLSHFLSTAPLRAIGRVSYGLYLWHWPVDVYLNPTRVHLSLYPLLALRTAVTVALAIASYHLVEVPIRTRRYLVHGGLAAAGATLGVLAAALIVLPSIGAAAGSPGPLPSAGPTAPGPVFPGPVSPGPVSPGPAPLGPLPQAGPFTQIPAVAPGDPVKVLVVGDSVGQSLTRDVTPPAPFQFFNESIEGCGVTFGAAIVGGYPIYDVSQCPATQQARVWSAGLASQPNVVIMSFGTWEVFDQEYDNHDYKVYSQDYAKLLTDQLQADFEFIAHADNAHIVLLDVPCYDEQSFSLGGASSPRNDPRRVAWVNGIFAAATKANPGRVTLLPISSWACPAGQFAKTRYGVVLRPDGVHYDPQSATLTWDWLGPQIEGLVRTPTEVPAPAAS